MDEQSDSTAPVPPPTPAHPKPNPDQRYAKLPERIRPEDMITEQASQDPGDPTFGGRDPERDWMLRYAG